MQTKSKSIAALSGKVTANGAIKPFPRCVLDYWYTTYADGVLEVAKQVRVSAERRASLMEAHFHIVIHIAHDENDQHDWCVAHNIMSVLQLQNLVTNEKAA